MYLGYEDILSTQPCDYRVVNSWRANHSKCRLTSSVHFPSVLEASCQTAWTQIRPLLLEHSNLGLHLFALVLESVKQC